MMRFGSIQQTNWDWRAAGNFIFGGTGGMLLLLCGLAGLRSATPGPGVLLALVLMGAGLSCVWLEIGRPLRALNVYRHAGTSWMTREAFVALIAFALGAAALLTTLPALGLAAGMAGGLFVYCQARMLRAAKGIPAWREPALLPLMLLTGLAEGMGLLLALSTLVSPVAGWLPWALVLLLVLRLLAAGRYRNALTASHAPAAVLAEIARRQSGMAWFGHALPAALAVLAWTIQAAPWHGMALAAAGLSALGGGWWMKFVLVTRTAHVQGYALGKPRRGHPLARAPGAS